MRSISIHLTPWEPLATMEKPIVAPTIQWVPEMGNFRNEAVSCHTADPDGQNVSLKPANECNCPNSHQERCMNTPWTGKTVVDTFAIINYSHIIINSNGTLVGCFKQL